MNRPLLLLNPDAGSMRDDPRLLTTLQAHPALMGVDVVPTAGEDELRSLARAAREDERPGLMVGGGDGTIHHAVNGLLEGLDPTALPHRDHLPTLAVLPMGTGNDLARSLGLPRHPRKALDVLDWDGVGRLDLMRVTGPGDRWCVNVVVGGLATPHAEAEKGDEKRAPGVLAYWRRGVESLTTEHPSYHLSLTLEDGEQKELSAQNVVVANGRYVAGGVPVAPTAFLDDGFLDLLAVPDLEFGEMAALLPRLLAGEHPDHPHLLVRKVKQVALRSEPALDLSLDGEAAQAAELTLEVAEGALNVVTGSEPAPGAFQDS